MSHVEQLVGSYRAWASNGASRAPDWLKDLREGGIAHFHDLGFPNMKQEAWRFTSVAPIVEGAFELAKPPARLPTLDDIRPFLLLEAGYRLVFVDGFFQRSLSTPFFDDVQSLAHVLAHKPELVRTHLGRYVATQDRPFSALNTAFVNEGAFVRVPAKATLAEPIQLLFLATGGTPVVTHPRNLVVVDREARASIVETYASLANGVYWTNAVTEIVVGDGARVDFHRVQRESDRAYHVATTQSHQGRDSTLNLHFVAFGGTLARHDIGAVMGGPGGTLILNGLYLLAGKQHVDHHTTIDHAADHCESHEYFNGVLDGKSRGVFTGRIIVRPGAQKTDSKQTNNNLLLSTDAHADSQPQLEIYADDVKCTHGSTVGPLDPRALFYLRSRGLSEREARRLLTYGFAAEILGRMEIAPLRAQLDAIVRGRLAEQ
ncbi:MAG TPA: Fe-S cluster assembly protein SufD [Gemmatimonadales bacterium]|jgi:Fe-S cluster assembly protein SufD|nr:Fe-S cluster assembly protein SufD [Gemmatimonadales bacterium]